MNFFSAGSTTDVCFCTQTIKGSYCSRNLDILQCGCFRFQMLFIPIKSIIANLEGIKTRLPLISFFFVDINEQAVTFFLRTAEHF